MWSLVPLCRKIPILLGLAMEVSSDGPFAQPALIVGMASDRRILSPSGWPPAMAKVQRLQAHTYIFICIHVHIFVCSHPGADGTWVI